jgi:hypothetical protein
MAFPHGTGTTVPLPVNQLPPVITVGGNGTPTVGVANQLSVSNGSWTNSPSIWTYRWQIEGVDVVGATFRTYTPTSSDLSGILSCNVTAHNGAGASDPARSNLAGPVISATAFYVSSSTGNDAWDGTAPAFVSGTTGPWKSLAPVNAAHFSPGTSVLFKRGDTWDRAQGLSVSGTLTPSNSSAGSSGHPIVYDAYGTGLPPILDGSVTGFPNNSASDWINVGTNLWQSAAAFLPLSTTFVVTIASGTPGVITISGLYLLTNKNSVVFAGGSLPSQIMAGTIYYIQNKSGATFNISTTPNGAAIALSAGSGTCGISGLPYFNANDVGCILWGFSALSGAPAGVLTASFGIMKGGGTNGVWYLPGDGTANIGTTQGNWNFNTDNCKVQIYSVGNPFTTMPGLRLCLDGNGVSLNGLQNFSIFQNLTFQNFAASACVDMQNENDNIIFRDCIFQWIGGGNIGGSGGVNRAGDGFDQKGTYNTHLIERCFFYQMYDIPIAPQTYTAGAHDNLTIRNCIFHHYEQGVWMHMAPNASSTQANLHIYANTFYGVDSWSWNQRPNPGSNSAWAILLSIDSAVTMTGLDVCNNAFAGAVIFGLALEGQFDNSLAPAAGTTWDYNQWSLIGAGSTKVFASKGSSPPLTGTITITTWKATYGWDAHGLVDVDPSFTNAAAGDFTPLPGSPLRNAGTNLFSSGVAWDFNHNPRPASGPFTIGAIQ